MIFGEIWIFSSLATLFLKIGQWRNDMKWCTPKAEHFNIRTISLRWAVTEIQISLQRLPKISKGCHLETMKDIEKSFKVFLTNDVKTIVLEFQADISTNGKARLCAQFKILGNCNPKFGAIFLWNQDLNRKKGPYTPPKFHEVAKKLWTVPLARKMKNFKHFSRKQAVFFENSWKNRIFHSGNHNFGNWS